MTDRESQESLLEENLPVIFKKFTEEERSTGFIATEGTYQFNAFMSSQGLYTYNGETVTRVFNGKVNTNHRY